MGGSEPLATITIASSRTIEISQDDVSDALAAIAGSERFVQSQFQGQLDADDERAVLTQFIQSEVLRAEAIDLGVEPSAEDLATVEGELTTQLEQIASTTDPGDPAVAALEIRDELGSYFDLTANSIATSNALQDRFAAEAEGGFPCAAHILVGPDDEALAIDLLAQLEAGADFATLAAENSIDPGSAANGGSLGCGNPESYIPEFRDALIAADVDELVGPVKTDFGFHIIKVTGYENAEAVQVRFASIFDDIDVAVDPAFGVWQNDTQQVAPPVDAATTP